MANIDDREKLNKCIEILDTTDLGLSMVWLWSWSLIKDFMSDPMYKFNYTEEQVWDLMVKEVANGHGFTLEYGAETNYEDILTWLYDADIMEDVEE